MERIKRSSLHGVFFTVSRVSTRTALIWRLTVSQASWYLIKQCRWKSSFFPESPGDTTRLFRLRSTVCPPWMWRYLARVLTWRYVSSRLSYKLRFVYCSGNYTLLSQPRCFRASSLLQWKQKKQKKKTFPARKVCWHALKLSIDQKLYVIFL